jgi:hypothetical protein
MQLFLFPLDRAAKLAFAGAGALLRDIQASSFPPKTHSQKVPDIAYWRKNGSIYGSPAQLHAGPASGFAIG